MLQYYRKEVKRMGKYKRPRQARWDARNLQTVSTHVTREQAAQFRRACSTLGASPYSVLQKFVLSFHDATAPGEQQDIKTVHNE